jgi:uncharacterized protein YlxW (UPF0749 family)
VARQATDGWSFSHESIAGVSERVGADRLAVLPARDAVTLLESISADALDPAYTEAAGHRSKRPSQRRPAALRTAEIMLPIIVLGLLLATALAQTRRSVPDLAKERRALALRIEERTTRTDALLKEVELLRSQVAAAQSSGLNISDAGREKARELSRLELAAGAVPVTGPGLRVVVDDGTTSAGDQAQDGSERVLDTDLQRLVNGLWAAGAEAVSINGQRVTGTTAIRSAGSAITVGFRPVGRPYAVEAVGDPDEIEAKFVDGPGGRWFRTLQDNYGIVFRVSGERSLRIPAAGGLDVRYARVDGPQ